jgi:hypothetical protein
MFNHPPVISRFVGSLRIPIKDTLYCTDDILMVIGIPKMTFNFKLHERISRHPIVIGEESVATFVVFLLAS